MAVGVSESTQPAAGIQPITLGSEVSTPKNDSGVDAVRAQAVAGGEDIARATPSSAMWSERRIGAEPSDHRPSIASPGPPIQKNAASALLHHQGERQTDHVAIELDRAVQSLTVRWVSNRPMAFGMAVI